MFLCFSIGFVFREMFGPGQYLYIFSNNVGVQSETYSWKLISVITRISIKPSNDHSTICIVLMTQLLNVNSAFTVVVRNYERKHFSESIFANAFKHIIPIAYEIKKFIDNHKNQNTRSFSKRKNPENQSRLFFDNLQLKQEHYQQIFEHNIS